MAALPPEIWREILARLPVKSVLRCRSVCKSCYSLISCPSFISHHSITNLHKKDGNRVLLQVRDVESSGDKFFSSHDESCIESCEHDDDQLLGRELIIVGSCNGLICLHEFEDDSTVNFLIWNPAIKKIVQLPSLTQQVFLVGFGFDFNTSDYKVVCSLSKSSYGVFDLRKGVWRIITTVRPSPITRRRVADCYVNGALHWSASRYATGIRRVIVSFGMSDESFREIRIPDCAEFIQSYDDDDDLVDTRCLAFGGLVHVIVWKIFRDDDDEFDDYDVDVSESCSVWAMKEYGVTESWMKVSNIDLTSARVLPSIRIRAEKFILWSRREILMVRYPMVVDDEDYKQDLVLYNTESRKSTCVLSVTKPKCVQNMCQYKESLVLM